MTEDFKGRVVWLTGASAGIGRALADRLAGLGADLILSSNEPAELEGVAEACRQRGVRAHPLEIDLADWTTLAAKANEALALFGRIDVLINNGGISQRSLVKDTSLTVDRRMMDIDYFGHMALTKAVLPSMLERRSGHIVVTTSVAGLMGLPFRSAYCAAKHALHGFFEALRYEVRPEGIVVTLVAPAAVKTRIAHHALTADGTRHAQADKDIEAGITPEECARRIVKAIVKNRELVVIGRGLPRWGPTIKRLAPRLYSRLMRRVAPT